MSKSDHSSIFVFGQDLPNEQKPNQAVIKFRVGWVIKGIIRHSYIWDYNKLLKGSLLTNLCNGMSQRFLISAELINHRIFHDLLWFVTSGNIFQEENMFFRLIIDTVGVWLVMQPSQLSENRTAWLNSMNGFITTFGLHYSYRYIRAVDYIYHR